MQTNQKNRLWTAEYIFAMILNALPIATTSMLVTTLPLFAIEKGGSEAQAGLVTTLFTITALLFRPITGYLLDKRGRKVIMIVGIALTIVVCILFLKTTTIVAILVLRFVHGIGFSAQSTSSSTILADVVPESRRGEGIGHAGILGSIMAAVGPALGLSILFFGGFTPLFYLTIFLCTGGLIIAIFFRETIQKNDILSKTTDNSSQKPIAGRDRHQSTFINNFIEPTSLPTSLVLFFMAICVGGMITFLPVYAASQGITDISIFFWVYAGLLVASRPLFGYLGKKAGISKLILPGVAVLFGCFVLLAFSTNLWMFLSAGVLYGLGLGLLQPSLMAIVVSLCSPTRRGVANATYFSTMDLGIATGAILAGLVAEKWGYGSIFLASSVCILFSGLAYWFFLRRQITRFNSVNSKATGIEKTL